MLAAENDIVPGAKVGGIGDVLRDIPHALADEQTQVSVIIPAYGAFHELPGATQVATFTTGFRGQAERVEMYEIYAGRHKNVRYLLLHHPLFGIGGEGCVYCDDEADQPFATDANKFALFSAAGLSAITSGTVEDVDVLHVHDWHAALTLPLIRFDGAYEALRGLRTVFSIHNLALQGIRPFSGDTSSLQAWFPHLHYDPSYLADPRWNHCVNPVVGAIRLADKVHTVSPTYAREILEPNDASKGFHGGEGLEIDLKQAAQQHRLTGIINGIHYPPSANMRTTWRHLIEALADELLRLITRGMTKDENLRAIDYVTHQRLINLLQQKRPAHIVTSVGRLTDQKMALPLRPLADGRVPLDMLLDKLKDQGLFILLGSGDAALEQQCQELCVKHPHFLFINHYSQKLSELLFANGDLFLMPSSFEPCGISQMLAMKEGQPCLAHAVGGLRDTIENSVDGFLFAGKSMEAQAQALVQSAEDIFKMRTLDATAYSRISKAARGRKFDWSASASRYKSELYS